MIHPPAAQTDADDLARTSRDGRSQGVKQIASVFTSLQSEMRNTLEQRATLKAVPVADREVGLSKKSAGHLGSTIDADDEVDGADFERGCQPLGEALRLGAD